MYDYEQIIVITCLTKCMIINKWKFDPSKLNSRTIRDSPVRLTVTLYVHFLSCLKFPHQNVIQLPSHSRSPGHSSCCCCWLCNKMLDYIATLVRLLVTCITFGYNSLVNLNVYNIYVKQDLLGPLGPWRWRRCISSIRLSNQRHGVKNRLTLILNTTTV